MLIFIIIVTQTKLFRRIMFLPMMIKKPKKTANWCSAMARGGENKRSAERYLDEGWDALSAFAN